MATRAGDPTAEATDLLRALPRTQRLTDGRVESGQETKSVDLLGDYLEGSGLDMERYEPQPGRSSLVARIEGSDSKAPSLLLMGHTDVVPVNPDGWSRDPFGAEIVDGFIWGRGAVDMLNQTATMAPSFRRLRAAGGRPPSPCPPPPPRWPSRPGGSPPRASSRGERSRTSPSPTRRRSARG